MVNDELTCIAIGTVDQEVAHIFFMSLRGCSPRSNDIKVSLQNAPIVRLPSSPVSNGPRCWLHFPAMYRKPFLYSLFRVPTPQRRVPNRARHSGHEYVHLHTRPLYIRPAMFRSLHHSRAIPF